MTERQFAEWADLVVTRLTEIRDVLVNGLQAAAADPDAPCEHPEDARISFATPGDPDHWVCKQCRHEHQGLTTN